MGFLAPTKRTAQPQGAAQIDWSNPISKGLISAIYVVGGQPFDAVSGKPLSSSFGGATTGVASTGRVIQIPSVNSAFEGAAPNMLPSAEGSIVWMGSSIGTPTGDGGIFTLSSSSNSGTSPYVALSLKYAVASTSLLFGYNNGASLSTTAVGVISKNTVLVGTTTSGTQILYKDGSGIGSSFNTGNIAFGAGPRVIIGEDYRLAARNSATETTIGLIYNRALSTSEVERLTKLLKDNPWQLFKAQLIQLYPTQVAIPLIYNRNVVELDFGTGSNSALVTVPDTTCPPTAKIDTFVNADSTTLEHSANDHKYLPCLANITALYTIVDKISGNFTIKTPSKVRVSPKWLAKGLKSFYLLSNTGTFINLVNGTKGSFFNEFGGQLQLSNILPDCHYNSGNGETLYLPLGFTTVSGYSIVANIKGLLTIGNESNGTIVTEGLQVVTLTDNSINFGYTDSLGNIVSAGSLYNLKDSSNRYSFVATVGNKLSAYTKESTLTIPNILSSVPGITRVAIGDFFVWGIPIRYAIPTYCGYFGAFDKPLSDIDAQILAKNPLQVLEKVINIPFSNTVSIPSVQVAATSQHKLSGKFKVNYIWTS